MTPASSVPLRFVFALLFAGAWGAPAQAGEGDGWRELFDRSLSNATFAPGSWRWENDELTTSADEVLWTKEAFSRFELELEFMNAEGTNSGVIVYADPDKGWIAHSLEIQIADDFAEKWRDRPATWHTGALFGRAAPKHRTVRPAGEWNEMRVVADGHRVRVFVNRREVIDADLNRWTEPGTNPDGSEIPRWLSVPLAELPRTGKIGLQGKHGDAPVWFRNLRWRPLPPPPGGLRVEVTYGTAPSALLENDLVRVRYGSTAYAHGAILELLDKRTGYDAAGSSASERQTLDNSANSALLTRAEVLWRTATEVAVELTWGTGVPSADRWDPQNKRQIAILSAHSSVLRIVYVDKWHLFEWGAERTTGAGAVHVMGGAEWAAQKGIASPYFHHKEPGFDGGGAFFKRERDGLGVPFNYRGHIVMGVYNPQGRGFLRVLPLDMVEYLKFMGPPLSGFETYRNTPGMVSYLAPISGGVAEIEALGREIVDWTVDRSLPGAALTSRRGSRP